jgi:miniconductance mechanosensitive channel
MTFNIFQEWLNNYFLWLSPIVIFLAYLLYRGSRYVLARGAYAIAFKTETVYDDLFVDRLQPFRFAWLVPLVLIYYLADYFSLQYTFVISITIILIIWFLADLLIAILSGINDVYKHNPRYRGQSVAGYIGIVKVIVVVGAIVLTISYLFEVEPVALLSGLGAWLAVLLLIFRDTILSFLASIQISTQQLIKEGDMVDIPAYGAGGIITNIDLQTITVENFDNTETTIPTSKIVEVGFKNYRIMIETGARRLKKVIMLNTKSVKFWDQALQDKLESADVLNKFAEKLDPEVSEPTTNLQHFIMYIEDYLKSRKEIRQRRYPFLVRVLEPTSEGLPLEIYVFVKASTWEEFEKYQSDIMVHLIAIMPYFDLEVPSNIDVRMHA